MAFTTWSALKTAILDGIANGDVLTASYAINGRSHTFRNLDEVSRFLQFCDLQIIAEGGARVNYVAFGRPEE